MNLFNVDNDINYLLLTMGKPITINNNPAIAIIGYSDNKDVEEKKIITKAKLGRGDLIVANNHNYIVTNEINDKRQDCYYKGYAQSCNYNIKFNLNGTDKEFPSIIESKFFDIATGKYFSSVDGEIYITLQDNIFTSQIALKNTFIVMQNYWEVQGIDKTKIGLITLTCKITSALETYTIETTNTDSSIELNKTLQFVVTVKKGSYTVITNPTIIYSSNNANCSVDTAGLITANTIGTSIIIASYTCPNGMVKSIGITITVIEPKPVVTHSYSLSIAPIVSEITEGSSQNYTITVNDNGNVVTDKTVTWTLLNQVGTSSCASNVATLTNITGTSCTVNAVTMGNVCKLKAVLDADNTILTAMDINIVGGW